MQRVSPFSGATSLRPIRFVAVLTWLLAGSVAAQPAPDGAETRPALSFGALPHHSLAQMEGFYAPLAQYLGRALGYPVRFGTGKNYARFQSRLEQRDFDLAFIGPLDYVTIAKAAGYRPLVRLGKPTQALFVVTPGSSLESLSQLRGLTLAVPPASGAVTRLALEALQAIGLVPGTDVTILEVPEHNSCYQHVVSGRAAACATTAEALAFAGLTEVSEYRVVGRSAAAPPPVLVVASRVDDATAEKIAKAVLAWPQSAEAIAVVGERDWLDLHRATDSDYESLGTGPRLAAGPQGGPPPPGLAEVAP